MRGYIKARRLPETEDTHRTCPDRDLKVLRRDLQKRCSCRRVGQFIFLLLVPLRGTRGADIRGTAEWNLDMSPVHHGLHETPSIKLFQFTFRAFSHLHVFELQNWKIFEKYFN